MKVAINGFGRIGRLVFRIMLEDPFFDIVAINDLTDAKQLAYLLKYDSNYRVYSENVSYFGDDYLIVNDKKIKILKEMDPEKLPWKEMDIDVVFECTGKFTKYEDSYKHIKSGSKKVLISAPGKGDIKTVVYNVNNDIIKESDKIISAASCTTNCLAPVLKIIDDNFKIKKGFMTTIHAYTNDQVILDVAHKKDISERRCRAATMNIIPTTTGAAKAIGRVLPNLDGLLNGTSYRVPTPTGSCIDLVLEVEKETTKEEINKCFIENASETINIIFDPIVSSDVIGSNMGALVDGLLTDVVVDKNKKQLIKVVAWYDNEYGYSSQMVRTAKLLK